MFDDIKNNFLQLSIDKQIKLGIFAINSFVCFIIIFLISFNVYTIMSMNYHNLLGILDQTDDQFLDSSAIFFDIETFLVIEQSKENIHLARNLLEIYQTREEYIGQIRENFDFSKKVMPASRLKNNKECFTYPLSDCVAYISFDTNNDSSQSFKNYLKTTFLMKNLLKKIFDVRTSRNKDNPIFFKISIYSKKYNSLLFYPVSPIHIRDFKNFNFTDNNIYNSNFTLPFFNNMMMEYKKSIAERYLLGLSITYNNVNTSIYETIYNNPNTRFSLLTREPKPYTYSSSYLQAILINTINMKYNPNIKPLLNMTNIGEDPNMSFTSNLEFIEDVIIGDWLASSLDSYMVDLQRNFNNIHLWASSFDNDVFSSYDCMWFIQAFNILNNISLSNSGNILFQLGRGNTTNFPFKLYDCIKLPQGFQQINEKFVNYFGNNMTSLENSNNLAITRIRNSILAFNDYADHNNITFSYNSTKQIINYPSKQNSKGITNTKPHYYKILRVLFPNIFTQNIMKSLYLNNYLLNVYVLVSMAGLFNIRDIIYDKLTGGFFMILLYVILIWFLECMIIIFVVNNVTHSLTDPIDTLTKHIKSIGQDNNESSNKKKKDDDLENINFEHDDDINDFFTICKNIIRGGLAKESSESNKKNFHSENVWHIKQNNIILDEEFIENTGLTSGTHIFSYKGNQLEERMKMLKSDFVYHSSIRKSLKKMNSKARKVTFHEFKKGTFNNIKLNHNKKEIDIYLSNYWTKKQNKKDDLLHEISEIINKLEFKNIKNTVEKTVEKDILEREGKIKPDTKKNEVLTINLYEIHNKVFQNMKCKELKSIKF